MSRFDEFCFSFLLIRSFHCVLLDGNYTEGTYWLLFAFIVYYRCTKRKEE